MCDRVAILQKGKLVDVKPIQELIGSHDGSQTYHLEVSSVEQAFKIVKEIHGTKDVRIISDKLEVVTNRDQIPEILNTLMNEDIRVYSAQVVRQSLEDRFLEITGGEQIA
jgi:ABC-2 type transport system ATP-binding protein